MGDYGFGPEYEPMVEKKKKGIKERIVDDFKDRFDLTSRVEQRMDVRRAYREARNKAEIEYAGERAYRDVRARDIPKAPGSRISDRLLALGGGSGGSNLDALVGGSGAGLGSTSDNLLGMGGSSSKGRDFGAVVNNALGFGGGGDRGRGGGGSDFGRVVDNALGFGGGGRRSGGSRKKKKSRSKSVTVMVR